AARELDKLSNALTVSMIEKRAIIFDEKHLPDSACILLSGVARITCRNRKGQRTLVMMVAPGMVPSFPPPVSGMSCNLEERLALILLELSETFGVPDAKGIRLTLPVRHRDLAELVGASRPRITEHLNLFERKGLISREIRQLVVNRDRLQSFLAQTHISANSSGIVA